MQVDILRFCRVILYDALIRLEKHILDSAHLLPRRTGLAPVAGRADADMLPSAAIRGDDKEGFPPNKDLEAAVSGVTHSAEKMQFRPADAEFIESVQVFHVSASLVQRCDVHNDSLFPRQCVIYLPTLGFIIG